MCTLIDMYICIISIFVQISIKNLKVHAEVKDCKMRHYWLRNNLAKSRHWELEKAAS